MTQVLEHSGYKEQSQDERGKTCSKFYEIPFTRLGGTCPWLGVAQNNRGEPVTAVWLRLEFKRGTNEHFAHPSKAFQKKNRERKVTKVDTSLWTKTLQ